MTSSSPDLGTKPDVEADAPSSLELPPQPRRRLLAPVPLSLLAVLLVAAGFVVGAHVQKGQSASGSATTSAFAGASRSAALGTSASTAGKASRTAPTSGEVMSKSGKTLYVKGSEGSTVKVATSAATTVTKTVKAKVKAIHPGEAVTITGSTDSKGSLSAESISVSSGGVRGSPGAG